VPRFLAASAKGTNLRIGEEGHFNSLCRYFWHNAVLKIEEQK
jgi:hypothetical protein